MDTEVQPAWCFLSHHDRYKMLTTVRKLWFERHVDMPEGRANVTVFLDGTWINDIPSFYLSLGEAINGTEGYFGACLDSLDDCLCGDFGILPPLIIRLSHYDQVEKALNGRAWGRFRAESFFENFPEGLNFKAALDSGYFGDGSPSDVEKWTAIYKAARAGKAFDSSDFGSYFAEICKVLKARGAVIVPQ